MLVLRCENVHSRLSADCTEQHISKTVRERHTGTQRDCGTNVKKHTHGSCCTGQTAENANSIDWFRAYPLFDEVMKYINSAR